MATSQNRNDYESTSDTDKPAVLEDTEKNTKGIGGAKKKTTTTKKTIDQTKKSEKTDMKHIKEMLKQFKNCQIEKRAYERVKTEKFLEVPCDTVELSERGFQTDFECEEQKDLKESPKFGLDQSTQTISKEIFDFHKELSPITEVVTLKTIDQSQLEVLEEEATSLFHKERGKLIFKKNQQSMEIKYMETQEKLKQQEKDMKVFEMKKNQEARNELVHRISAERLIRNQIEILLPSIVAQLLQENIQTDIETSFVPWIMEEVQAELNKQYTKPEEIVDEIIHHILINKIKLYITLKKTKVTKSKGKQVKFVGNMIDYIKKN